MVHFVLKTRRQKNFVGRELGREGMFMFVRIVAYP